MSRSIPISMQMSRVLAQKGDFLGQPKLEPLIIVRHSEVKNIELACLKPYISKYNFVFIKFLDRFHKLRGH